MAERIDGMAMRAAILDETRAEAARLLEKHGRKPGLATILVGDNQIGRASCRERV